MNIFLNPIPLLQRTLCCLCLPYPFADFSNNIIVRDLLKRACTCVHRLVGVGLGAVRHLGVAGRAAVHRLHPVPGGDLDRQVLGSHSAAHLLTTPTLQTTRPGHDPGSLAGGSCHHLSAHFWLVLILSLNLYLLGFACRPSKFAVALLSPVSNHALSRSTR